MNNKILMEYVVIESEYRALEEKRDTKRKEIVEAMQNSRIDKLEDPTLGSFTIARKKSWSYSPSVKKVEEKLKIAKVKEQQKGIAEATETEYLLYKEPKFE